MVEMWVNFNTVSVQQTLVTTYERTPSIIGFSLQLGDGPSNSDKLNFGWGDTNIVSSASLSWSTGTWYHLAVARSGTTLKLFRNGTEIASVTDSTSLSGTSSGLYVGVLDAEEFGLLQYFSGNISNLRIVKGTAVYTTDFTPPTAPVSAVNGTTLLLNFTNAGIYDGTGRNVLETVGDAHVENSVKDAQITTYPSLIACAQAWSTGAFYIRYDDLQTADKFAVFWNPDDPLISANTTSATGTWHHVAVVRDGTSMVLYVNGTNVGSATISSSRSLNLGLGGAVWVGNNGSSSTAYKGYIDDLRITKGVARYTANFTPPEAKLPNL